MANKFTPGLHVLLPLVFILILGSCKKENPEEPVLPHPEMEYFNLDNRNIKAGEPGFSIDVNHDGRKDIAFSTLLVGDPLNQVDKLQFLVSTNIQVNLPVNGNEEIPVINTHERIVLENFGGYHWFELASIVLVQKIISNIEPVVWLGPWKNAMHKFVPFQVVDNGKRYNGWVEISVDIIGEKIILHKAAISKEANRIVKAGE